MEKSISDSDILIWLSAFLGVQAICLVSLVWAIGYLKDHKIDPTSPMVDLVIIIFCGATCVLVATMLSPFVWLYNSRATVRSHQARTQDGW